MADIPERWIEVEVDIDTWQAIATQLAVLERYTDAPRPKFLLVPLEGQNVLHPKIKIPVSSMFSAPALADTRVAEIFEATLRNVLHIVYTYLGRQDEKLQDIRPIILKALGDTGRLRDTDIQRYGQGETQ